MLTVVLPTFNRPAFLERLLRYLASVRFQMLVLVADDSEEAMVSENIRLMGRFQSELRLQHLRMERVGFFNKVYSALQAVETPYVVMAADDDFFVPGALNRCVAFLEEHSDYSVVHGETTVFHLDTGHVVYGEIVDLREEQALSLEHCSAAKRLLAHLAGYAPTWYSLGRTAELRHAWHQVVKMGDDWRFGELTASCISVLRGKTKRLEGLYMVRQDNPTSLSQMQTKNEMDWLASKRWATDYETFSEIISAELASVDSIAQERARSILKQAMWAYLATQLPRTWHNTYQQALPVSDRSSSWLGQVSAQGKRGLHFVRRHLGSDRRRVRLQDFLRPSSPSYSEFRPVYLAIRGSAHLTENSH